jgi:hypothetical protein
MRQMTHGASLMNNPPERPPHCSHQAEESLSRLNFEGFLKDCTAVLCAIHLNALKCSVDWDWMLR